MSDSRHPEGSAIASASKQQPVRASVADDADLNEELEEPPVLPFNDDSAVDYLMHENSREVD